jgi:NADH-quinone oxidoreductase subunit J
MLTFVFILFTVVAIAGALVMVLSRNPVHSAIGLLAAMFSIAVFYVLQNAHFLAAVQVIIYAGAVMTLFLFVIMLIGVDRTEDISERLPYQRPLVILVTVGLAAVILVAGAQAWVTGTNVFAEEGFNGTIEAVADELFGTWTLAFLGTVFLLTIAAVGTVALAHRRPEDSP